MKENIKKAVESAEQEIQEKEIANLKKIVKDLLESKLKKEEKKREIEKEISIIKQTIDDFKAGRLDKVKELIEKDNVAEETLPFKVIIINKTVYNQPWKWTYQIQPYTVPYTPTWTTISDGSFTGYCSSATSLTGDCSSSYTCASTTGNSIATFTSGTYDINGKIINL